MTLQLVGVQADMIWEDKPSSQARVRALLEAQSVREGALVVLPEMFATGFSLDVAKIAEVSGDGPTQRFMSQLAIELRSCVLGGVVTRDGTGKGCNEAVAYGPDGREIVRYRKLHPFTFGKESDHYRAGDRTVRFSWRGFVIAPFICYDLRFPEVFRAEVCHGVDLIVVIACWPEVRADHWRTLLKARAIENQAFVVGVNRCGRDPNLNYSGDSRVIDPRGTMLCDTEDKEVAFSVDLDRQIVDRYRNEFPVLPDMRPDFVAGP